MSKLYLRTRRSRREGFSTMESSGGSSWRAAGLYLIPTRWKDLLGPLPGRREIWHATIVIEVWCGLEDGARVVVFTLHSRLSL
jgi:hypothetical protein